MRAWYGHVRVSAGDTIIQHSSVDVAGMGAKASFWVPAKSTLIIE